MKKIIIFLILAMFFVISCGDSKKTENDTDILPDEDGINDEDETDDDEIEDIDPCDPNPCEGMENSTGECTAKNADKYSCGCVEGYLWNSKKCATPCENIDCRQFAHASGSCEPNDDFSFSCDCDEGYFWGYLGCKKIAFPNICTGQTKCYNNYGKKINCPQSGEPFYGQDAQYAALGYCIPQNFSEKVYSSDESITIDNNLNIEWTTRVPYSNLTWEEAVKYCEDFEYAGYDDWRLPTMKELTLSNAPFFHEDDSSGDKVANLWSSNECAEKDFIAWKLNYRMTWERNGKEVGHQVRCVRGEPIDEVISFDKLGKFKEEVAFDYENGLAWQLNAASATSLAEALEYCENSNYSGFSDWRLPNVHELASLVNFNKFDLASDLPLSFGSKITWTWTSTTVYQDFLYQVFAVDFLNGTIDRFYKDDDRANILCVRNEPCKKGHIWNGEACVQSPCKNEPCKNKEHSDGVCYLSDFESHECGCVEGYFWDGVKCTSPCDPNPCKNDKQSTGECTAVSLDFYNCGCNESYFWDGEKCVNPCAGISCSQFEHGSGKCKADSAFIYSCECDKGYWWHGKEKGCLEEKPAAVNICTGQTKCYDNEKEIPCPAENEEFFGQDAQYARLGYCIPQSFSIDDSVKNELVVVDNNLGLMWQRKIPPLEERYIEDVLQYCEDLVYGGYSDWRLPTVEDFMSIADYGRYDPAVNTEYFPDSGDFWTATKYKLINGFYGESTTYHTIFNFEESSSYQEVTCSSSAGLSSNYKPFSFNIMCVRGGTAKTSSYILPDNLEENIVWSDSSLIVMKKPDTDFTWAEALKYCQELDYAGISEWRLPNVKELVLSRWGSSDFSLWENALTSTTKPADPAFNFSNLNYRLASYNLFAYFYSKKEKVPSTLVCVTNDPCGKGKFWNGEKCVKNPCDPNPCGSEDDLNTTCKIIDEETYFCGCRLCLDTYEHTTGECYDSSYWGPYCTCEEGYHVEYTGCVKD